MDEASILEGLAKQAQVPVDDVPAKLTEGEYVIPADVVVLMGNGDREQGFAMLDNMVQQARKQTPSVV